MVFLQFCLLFVFLVHSYPPFVASQFILDEILRLGAKANYFEGLSVAVYRFTTDLHQQILASDVEANVLFSPCSIYVALAMLYAGSKGETKLQLASALHLDCFKDERNFYLSVIMLHAKLMRDTEGRNYTMKLANCLFGQQGFSIKNKYQLTIYSLIEYQALDFQTDPSGSRTKINKWVERMTSGKIKELFPRGAITKDTVLALADAAYFYGSWRYKFNKWDTKFETFNASQDEKINVSMMHQLLPKGLRYAADDKYKKFRLLELPYRDERVSMIIALDDGNEQFGSLLRDELTEGSWDEFVNDTTDVMVRLSLPKFSLQQTVNLRRTLEDLGLNKLFEDAELSGISDSDALELSGAYHKAFVAIDEPGTTAIASTGLAVARRSLLGIPEEKKIVDLVVDREFLFLVVEKTTGCVLFFGHIKNPLKSN